MNNIDINSATWEKVVKRANARIAELREQNDDDHDDIETSAIRGRIAELKGLLEWPAGDGLPPDAELGLDYTS